LDLSCYVEVDPIGKNKISDEEKIYELKGIVIHRGSCYGGHYYAYIKDDLMQGTWDREMPNIFNEKPSEKIESKTET
jgi:ubiquitin C-terminal hydrolase